MKLETGNTTIKVPNGAKLFSDGMPRLTMAGFVGQAEIESQYALKVKNEDVYVDIRDFFPSVSTSRNASARIAENTSRMIRRQCFARSLAKSANLQTGESVLATPNAALSAQVSDVRRHLIGTTKEDFSDVKEKILSGCTVQVLDAVQEGGVTTYTTYEIDPLKCELVGFNASPEKNWIEQNNVELSIPINVALEALPETRRLEYEMCLSQVPNGGLTAPISGNGITAPFSRGFTACAPPPGKDPLTNFFSLTPVTNCVISMVEGEFSQGRRKFFVVDDISDLMRAVQGSHMTDSNDWWDSLKKVIVPIASTAVQVVDAFMDVNRVNRNGYALQDMENVMFCKNFGEVCTECGFEDIPTMLESMGRGGKSGANFFNLLFEAIPTVVDLVGDLFSLQNTGPKLLDAGEIDYSGGGYPLAPGELEVISRSTSGIGASGTLGVLNPFPKNYAEGADQEEEEKAPAVESVGTFSVGNCIPRAITWELDPYFEMTGGTMENVGEYMMYSAFDFTRIKVFLEDSIGFRSPCNTDVVSVHNFDSTTVGRGVAVLEITTQGSTTLTVPFPYSIVETPPRACLSRCILTDVLVGTQIDKNWLVVHVSDRYIGEGADYTNICTLTPEGFDIDPVDTKTTGWKDIIIRPRNTEAAIATSVRVNVVQPTLESVKEYRDGYDIQAYLDPKSPVTPGKTVDLSEIIVKVKDIITDLPFFYGTAADIMGTGFVSSITLNGDTESFELIEGVNTFVFKSPTVDEIEVVTGQFTVKVIRETSEIAFATADDARVRTCLAADAAVSGTGVSAGNYECSLGYADGGSYIVPDDGYTLDVIYPPVYAEDSAIGVIRVRPIDIDGYESPLLSANIPYSVAYVTEDPRYIGVTGTIKAVEYTSDRRPWVGEYPNPEDFVVTAEWATGDTADTHTLHPSSYTVYAYNAGTDTETDVFTAESTGVRVHWGGARFVIEMAISVRDGEPITLDRIEVVPRKGKSLKVPYGTPLYTNHFEVTGVSEDGVSSKTIDDHLHIIGYYPMFSGELDVKIQYGSGVHAKSDTVHMRVQEPDIVKVVVTPLSSIFEIGDKLSTSDVAVTAVTSTGALIDVPSSQVRITEFETGFIGDQTFMGTIEMVGFEGDTDTGSVLTSSFRYDVGLGGDETRFTTPALVCKFSKPYCFVNEQVSGLSDLGFDGAYIIASDGSRIAVEDTENVHLGPVDTSKVGMVYVGVEYTPEP